MDIKLLEKELNKAHEDYLAFKSSKNNDEYKKARDKYLSLADMYREEYNKFVKKGNLNYD